MKIRIIKKWVVMCFWSLRLWRFCKIFCLFCVDKFCWILKKLLCFGEILLILVEDWELIFIKFLEKWYLVIIFLMVFSLIIILVFVIWKFLLLFNKLVVLKWVRLNLIFNNFCFKVDLK